MGRWAVLAALLLGPACSAGDGSGGSEPAAGCDPSAISSCRCLDGTASTQQCAADGRAYLPCQCAGVPPTGMPGPTMVMPPIGTVPPPVPPGPTTTAPPPPPPPGAPSAPSGVGAVPGASTVGLEWTPVAGATGYRVYWSTQPGVTPQNAEGSSDGLPGMIQQGVANGTTYYYVVTAVSAEGESAPSAEVAATPGGEFVLVQLGTGALVDIATGAPLPVPVAQRVHVVLAAEGYLQGDLGQFGIDSQDWLASVFAIDPYARLREALVVWTLPRPSAEHVPGLGTAFQVPNDGSGILTGFDATAAILWSALDGFPQPITFAQMADTSTTALNLVVSFLVFDPNRGRAGLSGRATSLSSGGRTVQGAFARGHAHEFTHAFARVRDEYIELDNSTTTTRETSNVAATNRCAELPWQHLLVGSAINPSADGLVGAFGITPVGFHSEFHCLMNGTHDNAQFYGGSGLLRTDDRLCNHCRELTAFRTYERAGLIVGYDAWKASYRGPFFASFGFAVPSPVPQVNDQGTPYFEPCVP